MTTCRQDNSVPLIAQYIELVGKVMRRNVAIFTCKISTSRYNIFQIIKVLHHIIATDLNTLIVNKQGNHILILACRSGIFSKYMSKRYLLMEEWESVSNY